MQYSDNALNSYPFLENYFKTAVAKDNLAHCILFYGSDISSQYNIALEIARMLNCRGTHNSDCTCLNCNWIRENKHPAVMTISRVDNKPSNDNSKTVISIEQARMIKNDLLVTSDYHRVYIFCDRDKNEEICGLNQLNFQDEAANALLKTFEEPPANTTFFFLTKDVTDMINTIVSRAQSFYVPSLKVTQRDISLVKEFMDGYLELEKKEVLDFIDKINSALKDEDAENIFNQMQNYINGLLRTNSDNSALQAKLISDFKAVETAKKENRLNINTQSIVETLSFKIIL